MKNEKNKEHFLSPKAEELIKSYKVDARLDKEVVLNNLMTRIQEKDQKPVRRISWYKAVASIAASVLVIVSIWVITATENINASGSQTYAFRLPDDSRVVLNDGSSLSYKKFFWNRNVKLSGEAYFEVEKGEGFIVNTERGEVHVLGTRFLVREEEEMFTVQCYEGKVKTSFDDNFWILETGTRFLGHADGAGKQKVEDGENYPVFAKFSMNFSNASLPDVISEIEHFYGINIQLKSDPGKRFSGSIQTGNLNNALQILCEPLQLEFTYEDKLNITIH